MSDYADGEGGCAATATRTPGADLAVMLWAVLDALFVRSVRRLAWIGGQDRGAPCPAKGARSPESPEAKMPDQEAAEDQPAVEPTAIEGDYVRVRDEEGPLAAIAYARTLEVGPDGGSLSQVIAKKQILKA